jgi:hypothetical protein
MLRATARADRLSGWRICMRCAKLIALLAGYTLLVDALPLVAAFTDVSASVAGFRQKPAPNCPHSNSYTDRTSFREAVQDKSQAQAAARRLLAPPQTKPGAARPVAAAAPAVSATTWQATDLESRTVIYSYLGCFQDDTSFFAPRRMWKRLGVWRDMTVGGSCCTSLLSCLRRSLQQPADACFVHMTRKGASRVAAKHSSHGCHACSCSTCLRRAMHSPPAPHRRDARIRPRHTRVCSTTPPFVERASQCLGYNHRHQQSPHALMPGVLGATLQVDQCANRADAFGFPLFGISVYEDQPADGWACWGGGRHPEQQHTAHWCMQSCNQTIPIACYAPLGGTQPQHSARLHTGCLPQLDAPEQRGGSRTGHSSVSAWHCSAFVLNVKHILELEACSGNSGCPLPAYPAALPAGSDQCCSSLPVCLPDSFMMQRLTGLTPQAVAPPLAAPWSVTPPAVVSPSSCRCTAFKTKPTMMEWVSAVPCACACAFLSPAAAPSPAHRHQRIGLGAASSSLAGTHSCECL